MYVCIYLALSLSLFSLSLSKHIYIYIHMCVYIYIYNTYIDTYMLYSICIIATIYVSAASSSGGASHDAKFTCSAYRLALIYVNNNDNNSNNNSNTHTNNDNDNNDNNNNISVMLTTADLLQLVPRTYR